MAKKPKSRLQPLVGGSGKGRGMYRFTGDVSKGTGRMDESDARVMSDINKRDRADINSAEDKARRNEPVSKTEKMAYKDAVDRQNRLGARYTSSAEGVTGEGESIEEGKKRSKRLQRLYSRSKMN